MDITLYYTPATRAHRVRWLLEELQLPYEIKPVDLNKAQSDNDYLKIHPHGLVPAIRVDGETMIESGAICQWLSDYFQDKNMAPAATAKLRPLYQQWMVYVPSSIDPVLWEHFLHTRLLPKPKRISQCATMAVERIKSLAEYINAQLVSKTYLLGEQFSTADIMLSTALIWGKNFFMPYPEIKQYVQRTSQRPAFIKALETVEGEIPIQV